MVRMNDSSVDVPVSGEKCTTTAANRTDTTAVPKNFWNFERPSERSLRTFRKSSRKPTIANPTAANSKARPAGVRCWKVNRDARTPTNKPITMTMPPIVGVPIFSMCVCGPSSRIRCPQPHTRNALIAMGVPSNVTASANAAATKIDFTATPLPSARARRRATP